MEPSVQKVRWWETRIAEFLLTLASLALLAGVVVFTFQLYRHEMHGPTEPKEEARFYKEVAPHWQPKDFIDNSVVVDRDEGAMYAVLKSSTPFEGIRMAAKDKSGIVWQFDIRGKSYAAVNRRTHNASWILRSIVRSEEGK